jgi:hypothetical protein
LRRGKREEEESVLFWGSVCVIVYLGFGVGRGCNAVRGKETPTASGSIEILRYLTPLFSFL